MKFQHKESWDAMTSILALKTSVDEAWNRFIDFHEQVSPESYWTRLRHMDIKTEQAEIVGWLQHLLSVNPIPETIAAIWIGLFKAADNEIPTIYFSGAETYTEDDISWACDPAYLPDNGYAQPGVLKDIDGIFRTDENNYQFLDWIFPLAYCAFTFDEVFRTKLDKTLILKTNAAINVTVGYDSGDYIELTAIK